MGQVLFIIIVSLVILLAGTLFTGLLVLLAYGIGWLLIHLVPLSPFEATLLSLIGLSVFVGIVIKIFGAFWGKPIPQDYLSQYREIDEEDYEDDEDEEDEEDEEPDEPVLIYRRDADRKGSFEVENVPKVAPDTRCPCGSGRKYKNCHGRAK